MPQCRKRGEGSNVSTGMVLVIRELSLRRDLTTMDYISGKTRIWWRYLIQRPEIWLWMVKKVIFVIPYYSKILFTQ